MKKITVISGKGGTGKTSLCGSLAVLAEGKAVMADADVDAANLSLILRARQFEEHEFRASSVAKISSEICNQCDLCRELCRFGAISDHYFVDPVSCEGCAFCFHTCPVNAIEMQERVSGVWYVSDTPYGLLVHARLGIAEENSGKLVTAVRKKGEELAGHKNKEYLIIDGPPGIGCPVIASLSGVDVALVVTEPTVSGIHDLERVIALCRHFNVSALVCINRSDLEPQQAANIRSYCSEEGIPLVGEIPFDPLFVEAMVNGLPLVDYRKGSTRDRVVALWENITAVLC